MSLNVTSANSYIKGSSEDKPFAIKIAGYDSNPCTKNKHKCSWSCVDYLHRKIFCKCKCHKYTFSTKAQIRKREEKTTRYLLNLVAKTQQQRRGVLTT